MDGLGSLGSLLGAGGAGATEAAPTWQKVLLGGLLGGGEVGNILEQHKQSEWQSYVTNLLKNPQQIAQMATAASQPLSQSLIKSITNAVQGETASRGLGQSPGIFSTTLAQALAPYQQQNYNTALSSIMSSLGLPGQMFQKPQNLSPLLSMFLRSFGNKGNGSIIPASTAGTGGMGGGLTIPSIPSIPWGPGQAGGINNPSTGAGAFPPINWPSPSEPTTDFFAGVTPDWGAGF